MPTNTPTVPGAPPTTPAPTESGAGFRTVFVATLAAILSAVALV